jgi:deazaflavin-dependent oxidoreductase (nitroreductase family)
VPSGRGTPFLGRIAASSSEFANRHGVYLGRRSTKIHVALYRRTGGKLGGHLPGWPAARILLLDHTGAKSGRRRTSPLMYHEDGDVVAVVASKGGQPTHPAWFHNSKQTRKPRFRSAPWFATSARGSRATRSAPCSGPGSASSTPDSAAFSSAIRFDRERWRTMETGVQLGCTFTRVDAGAGSLDL